MGWIEEAISRFWSAPPLAFCYLFPVGELVDSLNRPLALSLGPSFLSRLPPFMLQRFSLHTPYDAALICERA